MRSKQSVFSSAIFAKRLKQRIKELSLKQDELAEKTGVGQSTISRYVNDRQVPELAPVVALAQALECDLGWLVGISDGEEGKRASKTYPRGEPGLTPEEKRILDDTLEILRAGESAEVLSKTFKQTIQNFKKEVVTQKKISKPRSKRVKTGGGLSG